MINESLPRAIKSAAFTLFMLLPILTYAFWYMEYSWGEAYVLAASVYVSARFISDWYKRSTALTEFFELRLRQVYLYLLPIGIIGFYYVVLRYAASWDVIDSLRYVLFYLILGIAWIRGALAGALLLWSFSYEDDALSSTNQAAMILMSSVVFSSALLYISANTGDGPGWWTIAFSGGIGILIWLILGTIVSSFCAMTERIVMDWRSCVAWRFGAYLFSMALILTIPCSGDWISFSSAISDFIRAWPVIPLTVIVLGLEMMLKKAEEEQSGNEGNNVVTILAVFLYLFYAVTTVSLYLR